MQGQRTKLPKLTASIYFPILGMVEIIISINILFGTYNPYGYLILIIHIFKWVEVKKISSML